jgi:hypothetical protein
MVGQATGIGLEERIYTVNICQRPGQVVFEQFFGDFHYNLKEIK